jgi:hypothetical protein
MQKTIASNVAAVGFAAAFLLLPACVAYGKSADKSAEMPRLSVNQTIDRSDARIADLKARLRLTTEQAKYWPRFEYAYHVIAINRAKGFAGENIASNSELQTGRTVAVPSSAKAQSATSQDTDVEARKQHEAANVMTEQDLKNMTRERDARNAMREREASSLNQHDAIYAMQHEADALDVQSADLREIADAAMPLYNSLDDHQRGQLLRFVRDDLEENAVGISPPAGRR